MVITSTPIKIIIGDSQEIFRDRLKTTLKKSKGIEAIAEADSFKRLIYAVEKYSPQIVITDLQTPVMDGLQACRLIHERYPYINLIGLAYTDEDSLIVNALKTGIKGYLLRNATKEELINAIRKVHNGEIYYGISVLNKVIDLIGKNKPHIYNELNGIDLSNQEVKIIRLLCQEMTTKEIAQSMNLSPRTVDDYRCKIQEKTGSKNSIGIARFAIKKGLLSWT